MVSLPAVSLRLLEWILPANGVTRLLWESFYTITYICLEEIRIQNKSLDNRGMDHESFKSYLLWVHVAYYSLLAKPYSVSMVAYVCQPSNEPSNEQCIESNVWYHHWTVDSRHEGCNSWLSNTKGTQSVITYISYCIAGTWPNLPITL